MKGKFSVFLGVLVLNFGFSSSAQQAGCDFDPGFAAFDFWVGEWDVFDNSSGNLAGSNSIRKLEQGCLVHESWTSAAGGTGTSVNYFNPVTEQWRQLWISAGRYAIDIAGNLDNGSMVLSGSIYYYSGSELPFRGTWTPADDGSVRQFFEQFNPETKAWDVWFDGRYVKK